MVERLDKFISKEMCISRAEAKEYIKKRLVSVNGITAKSFDMKIDGHSDKVIVDSKEIIYREHIYIMLNKPGGVVTAVRDNLTPTVISLIPEDLIRKNLSPAGRLDKDTEGFVFITDDGNMIHRLISPKSHVEKVYIAYLRDEAMDFYVERFFEGMTIDGDEKCKSAKIVIDENDRKKVTITLTEGKYHQVKRMIHALGNEVTYLKRIRIGKLMLDESLKLGEARELNADEVKLIESK